MQKGPVLKRPKPGLEDIQSCWKAVYHASRQTRPARSEIDPLRPVQGFSQGLATDQAEGRLSERHSVTTCQRRRYQNKKKPTAAGSWAGSSLNRYYFARR